MARLAIIAITALTLVGCATTPTVDDGTVTVVASTNVYGSIVEAIGGSHVTVTSLIDNAGQDPHSFEASAQNQLAISRAELIVENGGGYDPFVDSLREAASSSAVLIRVSDVASLPDGDNEHLWYDLRAMRLVADKIASSLTELDAAHSAEYQENAAEFVSQLDDLIARVTMTGEGSTVAVTEPVPLYLFSLAGYTNITPDAFTEAIEEGTDVPPAAVQETLELVRTATVLAYNSQTASPQTELVRAAALTAGVPVLDFSETLPDGDDYISWMTANVSMLIAL